jgi:hypothetical protein
MDSDFLEEYENREREALKNNISTSERLKLKSPIFNLVQEGSLWNQVALSGTVIFPLHPIPPEIFEWSWNLKIEKIPDLIEFVKDTKRIQFVLTAYPTNYKEFDYLEPILHEFSPPQYASKINIYDKKLNDLLSTGRDEFDHLISLSPEWQRQLLSVSGEHAVTTHLKSYILLRYYGLNEIADTFIENFIIDPNFANLYLATVENIILYPIGDSFRSNLALSVDTLRKAKEMGIHSKFLPKRPVFPEVGNYLMKKCTHYPESLDACKMVIDRYEDNDLYKVYSALNDAVVETNTSTILRKKEELDMILDNVWDDTTLKRDVILSHFGIDIIFGVIGCALSGAPGLLGMVIPEIVNATNEHYIDQFSNIFAKKWPNHIWQQFTILKRNI